MNDMKKTCLTTVISLSFLCLHLPGDMAQAMYTKDDNSKVMSIKSSALVKETNVSAACLLLPDGPEDIRNALAGIQLGQIPDPLGELVIERHELEKRLGRFAGSISIPDRVSIRRQGAILRGSDLRDKLEEICAHDMDREELHIDLSRVPTSVVLPGNLIKWDVTANSENRLGMRLFSLNAQTQGGPYRMLIQVSVARKIKAAKLRRLAKPGEQINEAMIEAEMVEVKSDHAHLPVSFEDAIGQCLGRFKSAGTLLRSSDLSDTVDGLCNEADSGVARRTFTRTSHKNRVSDRQNWLIKPGDQVEFHFAAGNIELTVPARATQGGESGEVINLINLQNQRQIRGTIVSKGKVKHARK